MNSGIKKIFFTSDWHLGHANVIKFDNRPFTDVEHMEKVLANNFNSTVPTDGVTYFLGDIGLCKSDSIKNVIKRLNGTKVLVLGNHDKGVNAMYNSGFDVVLHGAVLVITGHRVTMSHCPLKGVRRENTEGMKNSMPGENWHGESRHDNYTFENIGQFHLHGHIHSPNSGKSVKILDKQFDVGVAANGFRPVSISVIESWITNYDRGKQC